MVFERRRPWVGRGNENTSLAPYLPYPEGTYPMLWLIVLILVILAIAGGLALSKFIFLLLIVAIVVALLARRA